MTGSINLHAELSKAFEHCFELNNFANAGADNANNIKTAFQPILEKWHSGQDTRRTPAMPLIAYVLPGGDQSNANQSTAGLTPAAASIIQSLAPIANERGFSAFTANLITKLRGIPHEDHFTYEFIPNEHKRRRLGFEDYAAYDAFCERKRHGIRFHEDPIKDYYRYRLDDYATPPMGDVLQEKLLLCNLTSVDESGSLAFDIGKVRIKGRNLIVGENEFAGSHPRRDSFDRDSGEITLEYHRRVVVLSPLRDETALVIALKGPYWALGWMGAPSAPNPRALAVVSAVMDRLDAKGATMRSKEWTASPAASVLSHATAWRDPVLWCRAARHCQTMALRQLLPAAKSALEVFEVGLIKDGLTSLMKSAGTLTQRFELINLIAPKCQEGNKEVSINELKRQALSLCTRPTSQDIPILVSATQTAGPETTLSIIPNIDRSGTYEPLMALATALHELHQSPSASASDRVHLVAATRQCISAAAPQWEYGIDVETPHEWGESDVLTAATDATTRICDIVIFCYTLSYPQPCVDLLTALCQHKYQPDALVISQLRQIHAPLAVHLRATLVGLGITPAHAAEPYASFARSSIAQYLARALPPHAALPPLPAASLGCGCADCAELDAFVRGPTAVMHFKASRRRRAHVEAQIHRENLAYLEDYVTTKTEEYGSPYTLRVYKRDEVVAAVTWRKQKRHAEIFVGCICPDEQSLRAVMGARYDDVVSALEGTKTFELSDREVSASTSHSQKVSGSIGGGDSVIGTKRKHMP